jgi:hypothetical protein
MTEPKVNGDKQPLDDIRTDEIKTLVANLDEQGKQVVAAEAMKTASGDAKQEVVAQAVKSADTVEDEKNVVTQAVRSADTVEAKKAAAAEAVKTAVDGEKNEVVAQVVSVAPLEAKKAATAEAVNSASPENKVKVAAEGVEQLSATQQKELVDRLPITQGTADQIWITVVNAFKWVLWGATLALVGAIGVSLFRQEVDQALVQILLTVFTTVVGIFAGFIGGKALGGSTGE